MIKDSGATRQAPDGDGGEAAFRAALVALLPVMRAQARALTGRRDTADDLVQDSLSRALRAATRPPPEALRPWIFVIIRNAWRSELRRQRRHPTAADPPPAAAPDQDPEADAAQDRMEAGLAAALASLPPTQREALVLTAMQGLSSVEAGRICGVPEGTLRARASRARATLRQLLDGAGSG